MKNSSNWLKFCNRKALFCLNLMLIICILYCLQQSLSSQTFRHSSTFLLSFWVPRWSLLIIASFLLILLLSFALYSWTAAKTKKIANISRESLIRVSTPIPASIQIPHYHPNRIYVELIIKLLSLLLFTILIFPYRRSWGPIIMPIGSGANILWYTAKRTPTTLLSENIYYFGSELANQTRTSAENNILTHNRLPKTNFHSVFINKTQFSFKLHNKTHSVNFTSPKKFLVLSDVHCQQNVIKSIQDFDYDLLIVAGDATNFGLKSEFDQFFMNMDDRPLVFALGNHDIRTGGFWPKVMQREQNSYVQVGEAGFYIIQVMTSNIANPNPTRDLVEGMVQFLGENIGKTVRHKFIINHLPLFTAAVSDNVPFYQQQMEQFLKNNQDQNIRAYIAGHDHVFSAFQMNSTYVFVAGVYGGGKQVLFDESDTINGSIIGIAGGDYHLNSLADQNSILSFELEDTQIKYHVINPENKQIILSYYQSYD